MARKQESMKFSGALEPLTQKPLDGRRKVALIADLTDAASFPYIYKGLDVFCEENSKWYTFLGGDQTDINNWREEGTGSGGKSDYNDLSNKPKINGVELSGNKTFNDLKIRSFDKLEEVKPYAFENYTRFFGTINNMGSWGFAYDSKFKHFVFIDSVSDLSTSSQTQWRMITEGGLNEIVAELLKSVNVANSEPFTVAANSYEVGDYVLHKTSAYQPLLLWRVTKAIASGDTLYSTGANQNIEQVTLGSELKRIEAQGGGGGNTNFDIGTVPLGGSGAYEVNAILNNNDNERVQALYTRGANGELPDWFSMFVNSGLGSDTFHIATKEYADGLVSGKVDYVVLDVANFNMSMSEFVQLFYSDKLIYIKDGYLNHLVTDKYTWDLMPETEYELSYIEGNILYTYQFETSDDIYYRGRTVKPVGYNLAVGEERLIGTYREAGINYNVYSKIIKIDALPSAAGTTTYDHGISGIKQILQVYGFCSNGFVMNAPRQSLQDNIAVYQVSKATGNQKISIEVGKDRSSLSAYVCLVYAKNN